MRACRAHGVRRVPATRADAACNGGRGAEAATCGDARAVPVGPCTSGGGVAARVGPCTCVVGGVGGVGGGGGTKQLQSPRAGHGSALKQAPARAHTLQRLGAASLPHVAAFPRLSPPPSTPAPRGLPAPSPHLAPPHWRDRALALRRGWRAPTPRTHGAQDARVRVEGGDAGESTGARWWARAGRHTEREGGCAHAGAGAPEGEGSAAACALPARSWPCIQSQRVVGRRIAGAAWALRPCARGEDETGGGGGGRGGVRVAAPRPRPAPRALHHRARAHARARPREVAVHGKRLLPAHSVGGGGGGGGGGESPAIRVSCGRLNGCPGFSMLLVKNEGVEGGHARKRRRSGRVVAREWHQLCAGRCWVAGHCACLG
jgi:hypothetical protein